MSTRASRLLTQDGLKNQIGNRCHERRKELKMTQDGLCGRLSAVTDGRWVADRQEIGRIENGSRYVTTLELTALAHALDATVVWILDVGDAASRLKTT